MSVKVSHTFEMMELPREAAEFCITHHITVRILGRKSVHFVGGNDISNVVVHWGNYVTLDISQEPKERWSILLDAISELDELAVDGEEYTGQVAWTSDESSYGMSLLRYKWTEQMRKTYPGLNVQFTEEDDEY